MPNHARQPGLVLLGRLVESHMLAYISYSGIRALGLWGGTAGGVFPRGFSREHRAVTCALRVLEAEGREI